MSQLARSVIAWCAGPVAAVAALACGSDRSDGLAPAGADAGVPDVRPPAYVPAESIWLDAIGTGQGQLEKVCARGSGDPVAAALCANPRPRLSGLADLYKIINLDPAGDPAVTHAGLSEVSESAGLAARTVSALNPRRIVLRAVFDIGKVRATTMAVAFSRGDPLVELMGRDANNELHLYLLRFTPACASAGCTTGDMLAESVETNWQDWTLYEDRDIRDTPLDCTSCHQEAGPGTAKILLMRENQLNPLLHWFTGGSGRCDAPAGGPVDPLMPATYEASKSLVTVFLRAHAGEARYAGLPLTGLVSSPDLLTSFMGNFDPHILDSPKVMQELLCHGSIETWQAYRAQMVDRGLPVPFYRDDVLDGRVGDEVIDHFLELAAVTPLDPFDFLAGFIPADVVRATGLAPDPGADAPQILRQMCVRCHNNLTEPSLRRARFNVDRLTDLDPKEAAVALQRIDLARTSAALMPPRRAGELPEDARATLREFLRERCGRECAPVAP